MPFKILHMLPDLAMGGGQILLLRNVALMQEPEWRHMVCAARGGPMEADFRAAGILTVVLDLTKHTAMPRCFRRLVRFARDERIDLIHTNNTPVDRILGQAAALRLGIPVVNTFHALPPEDGVCSGDLAELRSFVRRRLVRTANKALIGLNLSRLIAVSDTVRRSQAAWLSLAPTRFTVIRNGLPPEALDISADADRRAATRLSLGIERRYPVMLNVGRLVADKGQRLLIAMMLRLRERWPDSCLLLAGEGEDRALLEGEITRNQLGGHVRLLGNRADVPALLEASDLFISASRYEGFGLAVLEAMAAGKPVVALFTPAIAEFLEEERSGIFLRSPDPDRLADIVDRLAADAELARRMGQAGRRRAREFSALASARNLISLYRSVLCPPS